MSVVECVVVVKVAGGTSGYNRTGLQFTGGLNGEQPVFAFTPGGESEYLNAT